MGETGKASNQAFAASFLRAFFIAFAIQLGP
jgi:hypothetical protein